MNFFERYELILKEHHLYERLPSKVPFALWKEKEDDLKEFFSSWYPDQKIIVCVDGVLKQSSLGNIDEVLQNVLKSLNRDFEFWDVSCYLGLKYHLYAQKEFVDKIKEYLIFQKESVFCVLGSGSLTDLIKHSLFETSLSWMVMPTALTVTAYSSAFAVLESSGVKRTYPSGVPEYCLWFKPVLEKAPFLLNRAGVGDLLASFIATGDWMLMDALGVAEHFSTEPFDIMQPLLKELLFKGEDSFLELVAANITMSGVAMTLAQNTTPLSGLEHAMSHCLDMIHFFEETPTVLHGEQVALCCGPALKLMDVILKRRWKEEDFSYPYAQTQIPFMEMLLNQMPLRKDIDFNVKNKNILKEKKMNLQKEFKKAYLEKIKKWENCKWSEFCLKQDEIKDNIKKCSLNLNEFVFFIEKYQLPFSYEKTYPPLTMEQYQWALAVACYQRSRCSLGDFFLITSLKPESFF